VIQFPILIGLFYVIRDGSVIELSRHLVYPFYAHIDWSFGTIFLGLDLTEPSRYIMPPLLVFAQFLQLKLSFMNVKNNQRKKEKDAAQPLDQQEVQQKVMLYVLPIMIGVFAFQFPAAVSLYWGVSTVFAIGQQLLVNRKRS